MHSSLHTLIARRFQLPSILRHGIIAVTLATLTHAAPLVLSSTTLPTATVGTAYSQTLTVTGGSAPYQWVLQSGGFPPGISLNTSTGQISGLPTASGNWVYSYPFQVYIRVTDSLGATAAAAYTVNDLPAAGSPPGGGTSNPPPPPPPPLSTYSVTLTSGTIGNGSASVGSFSPGTTVTVNASAPPANQWFSQWAGNAPLSNSSAATTTFTMPAKNVSITATYFTPSPVPQPVTGHPRLWINASDVSALRLRAVPGNSVYQNLLTVLNTCVSNYNTKFYPGGQPNPTNPDFGDTQGYTGLLTEQNALVFALFSLIDNDPNARVQHAIRARNLIMMAMNEAVKGHAAGQPFRDPMFALYNRGNFTSECWPLAIDWIYNATLADGVTPILQPSDKKIIRDVFMIWANDCLNASVCGGDHPSPIGTVNSPLLLPKGNGYRVAANNYYAGHARLLTMMSLCIDPIDDPAINPATPLPILGNSLRSYIPDATGAWLYQQFAMFADPSTVQGAFNLPATANVGLTSGGLSAEGGLYGHSYSYIMGEMLALKTAGFADTTLSGPQAALVTAPVWDRYLVGFANSIAPTAKIFPSQSYLGPIYQMASYGDVLRLWITPDFTQVFALKNLLDQNNGKTTNLDATRWFAINATEGGAAALPQRIQQPWSYGVQNAVLYFLILDPSQPAAADPRPAYASQFYDAGNGRLVTRTDWSANASIFTFRSSWESINHQNGDAGQFELYRKGEWLTKELSNYDNNGNGQSSIWHNALSLQNWCANGTPKLNFFETAYWPNGSQWNNGQSAGDPVTASSSGQGYTYVTSDMTKLYNRPMPWTPGDAALDIQHASRSILWLGADTIVVYDRATSVHSGFKRFNLNLATLPAIDPLNQTAMVSTSGGQKLFIQTLLPANALLSYVPAAGTVSTIAQLETMTGRLVVEDPSRPADVRFLHVIVGADGTATTPTTASVVQSLAGTSYSGAVVGTSVALFPVSLATPSTGTSYSVAAKVKNHYVTGLSPNGLYTVTADCDGITAQVVITPGGALAADGAGVLSFTLP